MSPCSASPALIKLEGDPVLERVADIFFAICPDLPIPKVNILPLALSKLSQTSLNSFDKFLINFLYPLLLSLGFSCRQQVVYFFHRGQFI